MGPVGCKKGCLVLTICAKCPTRKMPPRRGRAPLQGISSGYPMQIVAVDIVGLITPGEAKKPYILVVPTTSPDGQRLMPFLIRRQ